MSAVLATETTTEPDVVEPKPEPEAEVTKTDRKEKWFAAINKASKFLDVFALSWVTPLLMMAAGDGVKRNLGLLWQRLGIPIVAILVFLVAWAQLAPQVKTSLGAIPGPVEVWEQYGVLHQDHLQEQAKADAFYQRQEQRNAALIAAGRPDDVSDVGYTGKKTYYQQIWTSLQTVFFGFFLATIIAAPLGIIMGMSPSMNAAFNPLIQIFKPVSPLAWLPIVTMVVSATVATDSGWSKSFLTSAITVTLCSLWPTLINTALGVATVDKDLVNVGKVLKLTPYTKVTKLVLPSALPLIFTGMRLSLGVGWMVLIAAEMLAQNPGLGKFVWDEFQNGSSQSLAKIIVAVLTIGIIGFLLDRVMVALQTMFTFSSTR
ncbi:MULTISPECIES: ABC transporter permease [Henriciella]|jgi:nitrate/nitrite transport system permease protein|uniref:Nitrate transporter n=1 Tax=Henriciella pelagia TaxID=1977912 RepID=A0ABQ1J329_9PROT|nr:ABC transporter permease [Henriciella pelagia]GGB57533.1 nitrate transporter [Henriciella pelagia]